VQTDPQQIPEELKNRAQWVIWRYEDKDGKRTKIPVDAKTGRLASSTNSETWADFQTALAATTRLGCEGPGYVFSDSDPYCGVDLDDCLSESGEMTPEALSVLRQMDSYSEVSPSGRGVKVFVKGKFSGPGIPKTPWGAGAIEHYCRGRYFAITGNRFPGTSKSIQDRDAEVKALYGLIQEVRRKAKGNGHGGNGTQPKTDERFSGNKEILDELRRLIASHPTSAKRPDGAIHCQGLCHDGKSTGLAGALVLFPSGAVSCSNGCATDTILQKFGLPCLSHKEEAPPWDVYDAEDQSQFTPPEHWKLLDATHVKEWWTEPLIPLIDRILAKGNFLFVAAQTQTGKTLLLLYVARKLVSGGLLFGKYQVTPGNKVLYVVLEDPDRRIKERLLDAEHDFPPLPEGQFQIAVWPGFTIVNEAGWLYFKNFIVEQKFDVVFIDTYQRATPGINSFDDEKQSIPPHRLATLTRETGITLGIIDHVRKDANGKKRTALTLDDIKGTGGKAQNADCVILMERTGKGRSQIKLQAFSKDFDAPVGILLEIAPKGSTEPKFQYVCDLSDLSEGSRQKGEQNRNKILESMPATGEWIQSKDLREKTGLSRNVFSDHMGGLVKSGKVEQSGETTAKKYRLTCTDRHNSADSASDINSSLFNN
jgi:hypothetical protein